MVDMKFVNEVTTLFDNGVEEVCASLCQEWEGTSITVKWRGFRIEFIKAFHEHLGYEYFVKWEGDETYVEGKSIAEAFAKRLLSREAQRVFESHQ